MGMISYKISVILFIFFLIILFIFTVILPNLGNCKNNQVNEKLKANLDLVEKFKNKELNFIKIENPNKEITELKTFYDTSIFPDLENINYNVVKNELMNYLNNSNDKWIEWPEYNLWKQNDPKSSWKVLPLMAFTNWSEKNTKLFPKTTKQLKKVNGLVSAGFSKLGPETTLALHKGWANLSNNVLRCHLGIIVPENKCKVFVLGNSNDEMIQKEGKWIIFDDSLYHSASNEDKEKDRIILLVDIKRPEFLPKGYSDIQDSDELNNFVAEFNKNL